MGPDSPLVDAYGLDRFSQLYGDRDVDGQRPGSVQSCSLHNPEIASGRHAASDHGAVWVDLDL